MKKIFCLALVLILTMSVAFSASAAPADDLASAMGNIDFSNIQLPTIKLPEINSIEDAFNAIAEFLAFRSIMDYVYEFHYYMDGFYREFDTFLRAAGVVVNGILSSVF